MPSLSLLLGVGATLSSSVLANKYTVQDVYAGSSFFDAFNFVTEEKTNGFVKYVDRTRAESQGYISVEHGDAIFGVDYTSKLDSSAGKDTGRESVRLEGKKEYNKGLFVLDLKHMPGGICGTWPAFWSLGREPWPVKGEIDIIEGVNKNSANSMVLHTDTKCKTKGKGQTGVQSLYDCALDSPSGTTGCGVSDTSAKSYGTAFNANEGGYYVTEWQAEGIKVWFFPRGSAPVSLTTSEPDTSEFGTPSANFQGDCDIEKRFMDQRFIFSNTFCGDWGGNVYANSGCPMYPGLSGMDSCKKYVAENPQVFKDAYWRVSSFKTYNKRTVSSSSSIAPSSTPHASSSRSSTVSSRSSSTVLSSSAVSSSAASRSSTVLSSTPHASSSSSRSVVSSSSVVPSRSATSSSAVASSSVASSSAIVSSSAAVSHAASSSSAVVSSSYAISSSVAVSSSYVISDSVISSSSPISSNSAVSSSVVASSSSADYSSTTPTPDVSISVYESSSTPAPSLSPTHEVSSSVAHESSSAYSASEVPHHDSSSVYPSETPSVSSSFYPSETAYVSSSSSSPATPYESSASYPSETSSSVAYPDESLYPVYGTPSSSVSVYSSATPTPVLSVYPEGEGYEYGDASSAYSDSLSKTSSYSDYSIASSKNSQYDAYPTFSTKKPGYTASESTSVYGDDYPTSSAPVYPVGTSSAPVYDDYPVSTPSVKSTPVYADYPSLPSFTPLHSSYPTVSHKPASDSGKKSSDSYQPTTAYETTYIDVCPTGYTTITTKITAMPTPAPYPTTNAHYAPPGFEITTKYCAQGCGEGPKTVTVTVPCTKCTAISTAPNNGVEKPTGKTTDAYSTAVPKPTQTKVITLTKIPVPASEYYATISSSSVPGSGNSNSGSYAHTPVAPSSVSVSVSSGSSGSNGSGYIGGPNPIYPTASTPSNPKPLYPYPTGPAAYIGGDKPLYPTGSTPSSINITKPLYPTAVSHSTIGYPAQGTATAAGTGVGVGATKPRQSQTGYQVPEFEGGAGSVSVRGGVIGIFAVAVVVGVLVV